MKKTFTKRSFISDRAFATLARLVKEDGLGLRVVKGVGWQFYRHTPPLEQKACGLCVLELVRYGLITRCGDGVWTQTDLGARVIEDPKFVPCSLTQ